MKTAITVKSVTHLVETGCANLLVDGILKLQAERDSLLAATQWRPIDTAPKDGTWVLCKVEDNDPQYESILVLRYVIGSWGRPGIGGYRATHWMPLPNPPAA